LFSDYNQTSKGVLLYLLEIYASAPFLINHFIKFILYSIYFNNFYLNYF